MLQEGQYRDFRAQPGVGLLRSLVVDMPKYAVASILFAMSISACGPVQHDHGGHMTLGQDTTPTEQRLVSGKVGIAIPPSEMPALEQSALAGSGEAAYRLGLHFDFVLLDVESAMHWYEIASQNGSYSGMYAYAQRLEQFFTDAPHQEKARNLYLMISKNGQEPVAGFAAKSLKRMDGKESAP